MKRATAVLLILAACDGAGTAAIVDAGASDAAEPNDAGDASPEASGGDAGCTTPPPTASCDPEAGVCPAILITGDAFAGDSGTFRGFADPSLSADTTVADNLWLAYSWPHIVPGTAPDGGAVALAAVSSHLARSVDRGASFAFVRELYPSRAVLDPEGSGANGISSSETVSITSIGSAWYAAHLRYFIDPKTGYNPRYGTSWTVHVGTAASPDALADAEGTEAVLGVSTTAAAYAPNARLDQLAGLPITQCAILNNPTLFAKDGTLYLIVECLAFAGTKADYASSTMQVFATTPSGAPASWTWRHAGTLADNSLAKELGADTILQPDVSLAKDGTLIALVTRAFADPSAQVGTSGQGCVAVELSSIDPPAIRRDCNGKAVLRGRVDGPGFGACTHHAASVTGIVPTEQHNALAWRIFASGIKP